MPPISRGCGLNRRKQGARQAFGAGRWEQLKVIRELPTGGPIALGMDGPKWRDSTAIVATDLLAGWQWLAGWWEHPGRADQQWEFMIGSRWSLLLVTSTPVSACTRPSRLLGLSRLHRNRRRVAGRKGSASPGRYGLSSWMSLCRVVKTSSSRFRAGSGSVGVGRLRTAAAVLRICSR